MFYLLHIDSKTYKIVVLYLLSTMTQVAPRQHVARVTCHATVQTQSDDFIFDDTFMKWLPNAMSNANVEVL